MILAPDFSQVIDRFLARFDLCPWSTLAGTSSHGRARRYRTLPNTLYTPEQRRRRDETAWTLVQGILAPLQFAVFLVSLVLVLRFLATGVGFEAATASIVVKTLALYAIMVTGALWEREVFGQYLFAPAFFWEDVVSMLVIALHTAYLVVLISGALGAQGQMLLALAAYTAYVVNATQFLLKLRAARREGDSRSAAFGSA
ncbi:MAG TPA: 2-vinyl bacteriochlorophyllide hydratase [Kiloniellaceae bacterium]|nr:2-vinyl bacteriochlorophyllide hydratase [Kiloniellaceae bacterium]HIP77554.1 2-vinyl bacteriochlorophyllide hydratase [Kiloniellaceae bacterium]